MKEDGDNLRELVSQLLIAREIHNNPFPPSDIKKRWRVNKKGAKSLRFIPSTVKDIDNEKMGKESY